MQIHLLKILVTYVQVIAASIAELINEGQAETIPLQVPRPSGIPAREKAEYLEPQRFSSPPRESVGSLEDAKMEEENNFYTLLYQLKSEKTVGDLLSTPSSQQGDKMAPETRRWCKSLGSAAAVAGTAATHREMKKNPGKLDSQRRTASLRAEIKSKILERMIQYAMSYVVVSAIWDDLEAYLAAENLEPRFSRFLEKVPEVETTFKVFLESLDEALGDSVVFPAESSGEAEPVSRKISELKNEYNIVFIALCKLKAVARDLQEKKGMQLLPLLSLLLFPKPENLVRQPDTDQEMHGEKTDASPIPDDVIRNALALGDHEEYTKSTPVRVISSNRDNMVAPSYYTLNVPDPSDTQTAGTAEAQGRSGELFEDSEPAESLKKGKKKRGGFFRKYFGGKKDRYADDNSVATMISALPKEDEGPDHTSYPETYGAPESTVSDRLNQMPASEKYTHVGERTNQIPAGGKSSESFSDKYIHGSANYEAHVSEEAGNTSEKGRYYTPGSDGVNPAPAEQKGVNLSTETVFLEPISHVPNEPKETERKEPAGEQDKTLVKRSLGRKTQPLSVFPEPLLVLDDPDLNQEQKHPQKMDGLLSQEIDLEDGFGFRRLQSFDPFDTMSSISEPTSLSAENTAQPAVPHHYSAEVMLEKEEPENWRDLLRSVPGRSGHPDSECASPDGERGAASSLFVEVKKVVDSIEQGRFGSEPVSVYYQHVSRAESPPVFPVPEYSEETEQAANLRTVAPHLQAPGSQAQEVADAGKSPAEENLPEEKVRFTPGYYMLEY